MGKTQIIFFLNHKHCKFTLTNFTYLRKIWKILTGIILCKGGMGLVKYALGSYKETE